MFIILYSIYCTKKRRDFEKTTSFFVHIYLYKLIGYLYQGILK